MKKTIVTLCIGLFSFLLMACQETTTVTTTGTTTTFSGTSTTGTTTTTTTTKTTTTTAPTTTTPTTTTTVPLEEDPITLQKTRNFILVDVDAAEDLDKYVFRDDFGVVSLTDGVFSDVPAGLSLSATTLTATAKGTYFLTFTSGGTSVGITVFAKLPAENEYVIFQDSFEGIADGNLPEGYTVQTGTAFVSGGRLRVDGIATKPSRVLLPDYLQGFSNYVIETDFTLLSASEPTRWASVMFRYEETGYFQMAIRQNAMATNGIEFAKWINGGWNVPKTASFSEAVDAAKTYRLRIDMNGDIVRETMDGVLMLTYENANEFKSGRIGFQANGAVAVYDDILITVPEDYVNVTLYEFTAIPALYVAETGIQLPPAAMTFADSETDIVAMMEVVRPQVLILNLDANLDVLDSDGIRIMTLTQALQTIDGRVIPGFYIQDQPTALAAAALLREYGILDTFLISPDPLVIQAAREIFPMMRGILEIPEDPLVPVLDDPALLRIHDAVNQCGALGALLPPDYVSKENFEFLQKRFISVYAGADGSAESMYRGVLAGADGIIVDDLVGLYDFFGEFPENSLIRRPLVIGHRGMLTQAPENTIEGSMLAFEAGADVIELDIFLTGDNHVVVIHDATTSRTMTGNLTVETSTLEQLKALTILDSTGNYPGLKIPTLEEYFLAFQNLDVQIFIEIKGSKLEIVPALAALISAYEVADQVTVIATQASQVENMREHLPTVSLGYLDSSLANVANLEGSLLSVLNFIVPLKTVYDPTFTIISAELVSQLHYRGITTWPWTINGGTQQTTYYIMGVGGITTDETWRLSAEWVRFRMGSPTFAIDLASMIADIPLRGTIETLDGSSIAILPEFILIDDGGTGIEITSDAVVSHFLTPGTALILVRYPSNFVDGTEYYLYDDLVTIQVTDSR